MRVHVHVYVLVCVSWVCVCRISWNWSYTWLWIAWHAAGSRTWVPWMNNVYFLPLSHLSCSASNVLFFLFSDHSSPSSLTLDATKTVPLYSPSNHRLMCPSFKSRKQYKFVPLSGWGKSSFSTMARGSGVSRVQKVQEKKKKTKPQTLGNSRQGHSKLWLQIAFKRFPGEKIVD